MAVIFITMQRVLFADKTIMHHYIFGDNCNCLTHFGLEISLTSVVWVYDTYKNNLLGNKFKFTKHLMEGCWLLVSYKYFYFNFFRKNALLTKILQKKVKIEAVRATRINGFTPHKYLRS